MRKVTLTNVKTCIRLEQELGLPRGTVKQIVQKADGEVEVLLDKELDSIQRSRLEGLFNMKINRDEEIS